MRKAWVWWRSLQTGAAATAGAIDGPGAATAETLQATHKRLVVVGLDDEVDVVGLDGEVKHSK